ncbi:hypothetical protein PG999_001224 [Apiospora kogelbergensis]|uniref:Uncharacterized protein n=1 Tax=Apiospora kogelbergensis TaxID=1337665 RepID=A0AAW0RE58_9PEZI
MPLLIRTSSDTFWWPALTLKRGYNGTDDTSKGSSPQEDDPTKTMEQNGEFIVSTSTTVITTTLTTTDPSLDPSSLVSAQTAETTESVNTSVLLQTLPSLTSTNALPIQSPEYSNSPTIDVLTATSPSASLSLSHTSSSVSLTATPVPSELLSSAPTLPAIPFLSSTLDRTQANPSDHPIRLPSHDRDGGLSPDEITIIVATVVSFVIFLVLLSIGIRCAILQRRKSEARERARRIHARPPMSRLPPALKKPSSNSLRETAATTATTAAGTRAKTAADGEKNKELRDDGGVNINVQSQRRTGEYRIVIRPPPGYQSPRYAGSINSNNNDSQPPLGSQRPSATNLKSNNPAAVERSGPTVGGHNHWSLTSENGSVLSGPARKELLNRLSLTTTESEDEFDT